MLELIQQGGPTLIVIFLCSLATGALICERWLRLHQQLTDHPRLLSEVTARLHEQGPSAALEFCRQLRPALARVFEACLERHHRPARQIEAAAGVALQEQALALEGNLSSLGTVAVITPYVGLFGTVLGIIHSFRGVAGQGGAQAVSAGVAEALVCTAAGLVVAVLAVVGFNLLKGRLRRGLADMRIASERLIETLTVAGA